MKGLASAFIEFFNKIPKFDKSSGIYNNGVDNNYPELVESVIANSVTALRCKNTMAGFISGKGFGDDLNKKVVNESKGTTLLQLAQDIADSLSQNNGVFIHMNWNANYEIKDLDVLNFADCRVGKKDDNNHSGKIHVCSDWTDKKVIKKARKIDVFNPDKKVIQSQADTAKGFENYNGQVYYFKFGKYTYPLSPIHPCIEDADSEKRASIYKNTSLRKGFFGKTLVVTRPLVDPEIDEKEDPEVYRKETGERDEFRKTIKEFVGAENVDGVMHLELEMQSDEIDNEILFKNIESNIDDKLFSFTESSVGDNICTAYKMPHILIRPKESGLFASSGELIRQAKEYAQDETNDERMIVQEIINRLMSRFVNPEKGLKIIPLIEKQNSNVGNQNGNS